MSTESDLSGVEGKSKKNPKSIDISDIEEDTDIEYKGTEYLDPEYLDPEYTRKLRSSHKNKIRISTDRSDKSPSQEKPKGMNSRKKKKNEMRVWSSTEDGEDDEADFCPEELKIMGATAIGAIGIDCLKIAEKERKNSPNINGAVSGIIKRKIQRAAEVINTLTYKAEAKGDPTHMRIRNRELEAEVERLKLEEILRKRETDEMRTIVADLKKEIYELKCRLDDAEEDARRARESYRITKRVMKMGKEGQEFVVPPNYLEPAVNPLVENEKLNLNTGTSIQAMDIDEFPRISTTEVGNSATRPPEEKAKPEKKVDNKTQIEEINLRIKDLIREKRELRRTAESENNETGSGGFAREKPLPQRIPKNKPRVISNIQVALSRSGNSKKVGFADVTIGEGNKTDSSQQEWTEVTKRRGSDRRRSSVESTPPSSRSREQPGSTSKVNKEKASAKPGVDIRRPPKSAAVMITDNKESFSYAEALKKARSSISLEKLKIGKTKIRKAANGSLLIEVMGPGGAEKALILKDELQKVLKDEAKITRPVTKGELRLIGLHDATSRDEIFDVISVHGKCMSEDIKIGPIHPLRNGLFTVWVQCPLGAAIRIANFKKISIGWTQVRVDLLDRRPPQCFRCWKFGHLRHACPSGVDFGSACFRCGGEGHMARNCGASPACRVCRTDGRAFNHRLGSSLCPAIHVSARVRPIPTSNELSTGNLSASISGTSKNNGTRQTNHDDQSNAD
ncbi:gag-pol polyprotein [Lasius niger]|uniref:Gag-pol polyprotein n=1 Tax=Lasius niger TaxID=67767 RepID=A0A0J7KHQ5_LASNI|nr:gag-pol polyprotein [Lasius niger]